MGYIIDIWLSNVPQEMILADPQIRHLTLAAAIFNDKSRIKRAKTLQSLKS